MAYSEAKLKSNGDKASLTIYCILIYLSISSKVASCGIGRNMLHQVLVNIKEPLQFL